MTLTHRWIGRVTVEARGLRTHYPMHLHSFTAATLFALLLSRGAAAEERDPIDTQKLVADDSDGDDPIQFHVVDRESVRLGSGGLFSGSIDAPPLP